MLWVINTAFSKTILRNAKWTFSKVGLFINYLSSYGFGIIFYNITTKINVKLCSRKFMKNPIFERVLLTFLNNFIGDTQLMEKTNILGKKKYIFCKLGENPQ